jgi:hypothetical protein
MLFPEEPSKALLKYFSDRMDAAAPNFDEARLGMSGAMFRLLLTINGLQV